MRTAQARTQAQDDDESAFVSMTDLTVSFLFIVMLLMAFFAARYADKTPDPLEDYLQRAALARLTVLKALRDGIQAEFPNLVVEISTQGDALHFRGEGLFEHNASALLPRPRRIVEAIADSLHEVLPCYTLGAAAAWHEDCNPHFAVIEAVQVEGHTDTEGAEIGNLMLSTARANVAFGTMLNRVRQLTEHLNVRGQPVLSVAGYGWMRPIATNATVEGRARNRRIDLRVIMHTPAGTEDVERIVERLRSTVDMS